ncbi:putative 40S ribosomal protein S8 [Paratrimastix pyriformis]|uniref:40S ribosomal protein S8 n=1 Tax=Paratrimastix pyriformis TaxID=342808 RepID=A0ABQ8UH82_9EUKA|nr:putative 40S ribosomal protein S8 [Paratrimastix pyriformis]
MGITRDSVHKRRLTGGKRREWRKKRKFELGRPAAMTHLGGKRIHTVRCRGGNIKFRALRLDHGNFSWGTEVCTRKSRIIDVVYNASNNELVRTQTLVKGCIVEVDPAPYAAWYEQHYGVALGKKKKDDETAPKEETKEEKKPEKKSKHLLATIAHRKEGHELAKSLLDQFASGRLLARISSRPGQCGRCDGYILEGAELEFYTKKMTKKKAVRA